MAQGARTGSGMVREAICSFGGLTLLLVRESVEVDICSLYATVGRWTNQPKSVLVYRTSEGRLPFDEWLRDLRDQNAVARVLARIGRIRQGNMGGCKPVGEGVSELRVDHWPGYRVYFGQKGATLVILLCGGDKRTQQRDIRLAKDYWNDYEKRGMK